jgi:FkbM family methyltransferase
MGLLKRALTRLANGLLKPCGLQLTGTGRLSLESALARISARAIRINTVIDVGASDGRWSRAVWKHFPGAYFFLIEANRVHEKKLHSFKRKTPNADFVLAAAGDGVGEINFDASSPFGGLATHEDFAEYCKANRQGGEPPRTAFIRVPMTTVDTQVEIHALPPPYFLKLDTHGFEVSILQGAARTLQQTQLLQIETYNFQLTDSSLTFYEMCGYLVQRGFRPIDLCDPLHRPRDGSLWQLDLFFIRADRPEFHSNRYA